jgi:HlyD family secretion protein
MRTKGYVFAGMICCGMIFTSCGNRQHDFDATGTFEATEITVSSESAGRILALDVSEGREVAAGERVGMIDTVQLYLTKLQLIQSASSVRSSRPDVGKQLAALEEQLAKQQTERRRVEKLLEAEAATEKQLDDVTSAIAVLGSQVEAMQSSLRKSAASLEAQSAAMEIQIAQVEERLARCAVASPVAGVVLAKYAEAGEFAVAGRPLFKVADMRRLFLRAYVALPQLKDVKLGQQVRVFADFGGDNRREYAGRVAWISARSEFTPKGIQTKDDRENLVYAVRVEIENDGYVKIGMYGEMVFDCK